MNDKEAYEAVREMHNASALPMSDIDRAERYVRTIDVRAKLWIKFATAAIRSDYVRLYDDGIHLSVGRAADVMLHDFEQRFPLEGT